MPAGHAMKFMCCDVKSGSEMQAEILISLRLVTLSGMYVLD
jgi:hypothetical protein